MNVTSKIHVHETDQNLTVSIRAIDELNVSVSLDGMPCTYSVSQLRGAGSHHKEPHVRRFWSQIEKMALEALDARVRQQEEARRRRIATCSAHGPAQESKPTCYMGPVARPPYTDENPAAHGNIQVTETCRCGAERKVLINGPHMEYSPWSA